VTLPLARHRRRCSGSGENNERDERDEQDEQAEQAEQAARAAGGPHARIARNGGPYELSTSRTIIEFEMVEAIDR